MYIERELKLKNSLFSFSYRSIVICFVLISIVFGFLKISEGNNLFSILFVAFSFISYALFFSVKTKINVTLFYCFSFFILLEFFGLISGYKDRLLPAFGGFVFLASAIIGYLVAELDCGRKLSKFLFYITHLYVIVAMVSIGFFGSPDEFNFIFEGGSRNYVSSVLIFSALFYIAAHSSSDKDNPSYYGNIKLTYLIITVILCVFLYGRSGIALSFLLLFSVVAHQTFYSKNMAFSTLFILIIAVVSLVLIFNINYLIDGLARTNFAHGFHSLRFKMVDEYLSSLGLTEFFLGNDLRCCPSIVYEEENPHNSFIWAHSKYGFAAILFFIYLFWFLVKSAKRNILIFTVAAFFLVRAYFDILSMFYYFDFLIFYCIFLVQKNAKKSKVN